MRWLIRFVPAFIVAAGVRGFSAENWTEQEWDVIVVGAGPAGIIGRNPKSSDSDSFD